MPWGASSGVLLGVSSRVRLTQHRLSLVLYGLCLIMVNYSGFGLAAPS